MHRLAALFLLYAILTVPAMAQDRSIVLAAPPELTEGGFLRYVLPRFSLKHGVRVTVVGPSDEADLRLLLQGSEGRPVFNGPDGTYRMVVSAGVPAPMVETFETWVLSTAGQAAVAGFTVDGVAPFGPPQQAAAATVEIAYDGDVADGQRLSLGLCGRCHVIGEINRMSGIGSTPSFGVLRTMPDWENRFVAFYVLKPHGAFTQVKDVTAPFAPESPPPIAPIEMTLDQLDDIVAYVAQIAPADLGSPIEHQ